MYLIKLIIIIFGHIACGILVPQPEIEPETPALKAQSLNRWTTREVQFSGFFLNIRYLTGHNMVISSRSSCILLSSQH